MRWLTLGAVGIRASCSYFQPAPAPKAPTAAAPPAMMNKAEAENILKQNGYTSAALVPSGSSIGGWSGTAMKGGVKQSVTVDKNGNLVP